MAGTEIGKYTLPSIEDLGYDDLKVLCLQLHSDVQWLLGDCAVRATELATYGDRTLKQFADDILVPFSTLRSYMAVAKAFPQNVRRRTISWSVFAEWASLPEARRLELVAEHDGWTVRDARKRARELAPQPGKPLPGTTGDLHVNEDAKPGPDAKAQAKARREQAAALLAAREAEYRELAKSLGLELVPGGTKYPGLYQVMDGTTCVYGLNSPALVREFLARRQAQAELAAAQEQIAQQAAAPEAPAPAIIGNGAAQVVAGEPPAAPAPDGKPDLFPGASAEEKKYIAHLEGEKKKLHRRVSELEGIEQERDRLASRVQQLESLSGVGEAERLVAEHRAERHRTAEAHAAELASLTAERDAALSRASTVEVHHKLYHEKDGQVCAPLAASPPAEPGFAPEPDADGMFSPESFPFLAGGSPA